MAYPVTQQPITALRLSTRSSLKALRNVLSIVLVMAITLVLLELALNLFDPLGMAYFQQLIYLEPFYVDGGGGYVLPPGVYHMKNWTATIQDDFTRAVPDSGLGCKVLFVGDSLTFGWGVNDDEGFVNLVARELDVRAINAGTVGYNAENVASSLDQYDAYDLAVYLLFENDDLVPLPYGGNSLRSGEHHFQRLGFHQSDRPLTALYAIYLFNLGAQKELTASREDFFAAMNRIASRDNVLIFGFDTDVTSAAQEAYPVQVIPWYTTNISKVDLHPDAAGHQHIAGSMMPFIQQRLGENCAV
jgi:lysophospholipase L1-like esterase